MSKSMEDYFLKRKLKTKNSINFLKKLMNNFPDLFNTEYETLKYGVECESGWFDLIYELTKQINTYAKKNNIKINIVQIKQKWAGLRYYIKANDYPKELFNMIRKAENRSYQICEICGKPGKINDTKLPIKTLCKKHWNR